MKVVETAKRTTLSNKYFKDRLTNTKKFIQTIKNEPLYEEEPVLPMHTSQSFLINESSITEIRPDPV